MQRIALIAILAGSLACSSGARLALTPDGGPPTDSTNDAGSLSDAGALDVAPDSPDADPCSPYKGGLGFILESRLPSGSCTAPASCELYTAGECPGNPKSPSPTKQWQCTCQSGNWACTMLSVGKLDCGPTDAGPGDVPTTSPDAPYCCPRDTTMQGCMRLGGVNQFGCYAICDFWCSTNWRVETDQFGCERWEYDYRKPAPGENDQCLPAQDAGAFSGA